MVKKVGRGILSVLLVTTLALGLVPTEGGKFVLEKMGAWIEVQAEGTIVDSGTCGNNLTWVLTKDGTLTISGKGKMEDWPDRGNSPWYDVRKAIKKIIITDGVTTIGNWAFYFCSSLTEVSIPDSVTSIGESAFYFCNSLKEINIPDGVTSIGESAFYNCYSLKEVNIPDGVTSIGTTTFTCCYSLTKINIPDSVTSIGSSAFISCSSLKKITIGKNVTSIGDNAFSNCTSLKKVVIPAKVKKIGRKAFYNCTNLRSLTIRTKKLTAKTVGSEVFGKYSYRKFYSKKVTVTVPKEKYKTYKKLLKKKGLSAKTLSVKVRFKKLK